MLIAEAVQESPERTRTEEYPTLSFDGVTPVTRISEWYAVEWTDGALRLVVESAAGTVTVELRSVWALRSVTWWGNDQYPDEDGWPGRYQVKTRLGSDPEQVVAAGEVGTSGRFGARLLAGGAVEVVSNGAVVATANVAAALADAATVTGVGVGTMRAMDSPRRFWYGYGLVPYLGPGYWQIQAHNRGLTHPRQRFGTTIDVRSDLSGQITSFYPYAEATAEGMQVAIPQGDHELLGVDVEPLGQFGEPPEETAALTESGFLGQAQWEDVFPDQWLGDWTLGLSPQAARRGDNIVRLLVGTELVTRLEGSAVKVYRRQVPTAAWQAPVTVVTGAGSANPLSDGLGITHLVRQAPTSSYVSQDLGLTYQPAPAGLHDPELTALLDRTDLVALSHGLTDGLALGLALADGQARAVPMVGADVLLGTASSAAQGWLHQLADGRWQAGIWEGGRARDWVSATVTGDSAWSLGRDDQLGNAAKLVRMVFAAGADGQQVVCGYDQTEGRFRVWWRPNWQAVWSGPHLNIQAAEAAPWCYQRPTGEWEAGWLPTAKHVAQHPAGAWEEIS